MRTDPTPAELDSNRPANLRHLGVVADELVAAIKAVSMRLERRIDQLEQRPSLAWHGVHTIGETYPRGAVVALRGLWIAVQPTSATPGTPGSGWQLAVKGK